MGPTRVAALLLVAGPWAIPGLAQGGPDANTQATTYVEAFLHGKFNVVARLTHPTVLAKQKQALLQGYDEAAKAGTQREYLETLGLKQTREELAAMTDAACFIACAEGNQRRNPDAIKAMKKAKFSMLEGTLLPDQHYQAAFRVETPSGKGSNLQRLVVVLEMTPDGWRVLGVST